MAQGSTLKVNGYREFLWACSNADRETKRYVRGTFRSVGDTVKTDAALRLGTISSRSAAGFKTRVRQRGIAVEQSLRRTTGRRPDWGATQMRRALLPALEENEGRTVREFEQAVDKVADHFERRP